MRSLIKRGLSPTAWWFHFVVEPWPQRFRLKCYNMAWICLLYTCVVRLKPRHVVLQIFAPSGASLWDLPVPGAQSCWEVHPCWGRMGSRRYWNLPSHHRAHKQPPLGRWWWCARELLGKWRDHPSVSAAPQRESPELFAAIVEVKITVFPWSAACKENRANLVLEKHICN